MIEKYFMHRIQKENGSFSKGLEVHDTLDSAILSYHGRMKLAGVTPGLTFMTCKILNANGKVLPEYNETWKDDAEGNTFFMHHVRLDNGVFSKDIDICASFEAAKAALHAQMEYGYGNTKFPNVEYVSCMVSDMSGTMFLPETWSKQDPEPEPEQTEPEGE